MKRSKSSEPPFVEITSSTVWLICLTLIVGALRVTPLMDIAREFIGIWITETARSHSSGRNLAVCTKLNHAGMFGLLKKQGSNSVQSLFWTERLNFDRMLFSGQWHIIYQVDNDKWSYHTWNHHLLPVLPSATSLRPQVLIIWPCRLKLSILSCLCIRYTLCSSQWLKLFTSLLSSETDQSKG